REISVLRTLILHILIQGSKHSKILMLRFRRAIRSRSSAEQEAESQPLRNYFYECTTRLQAPLNSMVLIFVKLISRSCASRSAMCHRMFFFLATQSIIISALD